MTTEEPGKATGRRGQHPPDRQDERSRDRQRHRDAVFGDVLPEQTRDEAEQPDDPTGGERDADAWLRDQVPPHHGG